MRQNKKEKIDTLRLVKRIGIFLLCVLCLPLIDFLLVKVVKQEPIFTFQTKEVDNGNAFEYVGLGYKIVRCNIDENTSSKFGILTMKHSCKIDAVVEIDTAREYSPAMSSIRGIPFETRCTNDLTVKAYMDKNVDVGTFYKDNNQQGYKSIETKCNSTFYFGPEYEAETMKDIKVFIEVIDGSTVTKKEYIIDYDNFFYRAYDNTFTVIEPTEIIEVKEKIYEDDNNIYYLNMASNGFFISYPELGRVSLTDALANHMVSVNQLIRRGMEIITEEKEIDKAN